MFYVGVGFFFVLFFECITVNHNSTKTEILFFFNGLKGNKTVFENALWDIRCSINFTLSRDRVSLLRPDWTQAHYVD